SPAKWHLAHTTWFFETFVLEARGEGPRLSPAPWRVLFNSYYETVGPQHPRPERGLLSRPSLDEVLAWRGRVDEAVDAALEAGLPEATARVVELGVHHEMQHQELLLTDLKHLLSRNPLAPAYREVAAAPSPPAPPMRFLPHPGGPAEIGHRGRGFAFDNEGPRHRVWLRDFALASRPVTCGEYLEFVREGGYGRPELWLSDGFAFVQQHGIRGPLYWTFPEGGEEPRVFTLRGLVPFDRNAPVAHLSYYEADAYARFAGARLPTEAEWEVVASRLPVEGNLLERGLFEPCGAEAGGPEPAQLYGDVWEWTASSYEPYPGYRPPTGALGEYNGKFMCNQRVLRGGSCATPRAQIRATYRNFFYPHQRWQWSGLRLARDL
ncbi:MAG: ergothioneine biosynthesis protein EgtB, partial [Nitrospirae bacterium]